MANENKQSDLVKTSKVNTKRATAQLEGNQPAPPVLAPEIVLSVPASQLSYIGPSRANKLAKLELRNALELLFYFPNKYEDLSDLRTIDELEEGVTLAVRGVVEEVDGTTSGFGKSKTYVLIRCGDDFLRAIWFNQPFQRTRFQPGQHVMFSAKATLRGGRWQMSHPRAAFLEGADDVPKTEILPVYGLTEGIPQYQMRRMLAGVVKEFAHVPPEVFPEYLLQKYSLLPLREALQTIHAPESMEALDLARRRFVFQELLILQLALAFRRWQQQSERQGTPLPTTPAIDARIKRLFPFDLTNGQLSIIEDIAIDMGKDHAMNRLLQGDVGSGKTVAAVYAMLLCVANKHQAVIMAPTEILARQHAQTFAGILRASQVSWALLTGGTSTHDRQITLAKLAAGEIDLLIGTHAVLQETVKFKNLGLVVIDEQHKFGVRQRAALRSSGENPHYLVMTATPIPRTVTMALFGDLDVSTLKEMPPGRQKINSYLVEPEKQAAWWQFVRDQLNSQRQAYVVSPLVDSSENVNAASAEETFENLANGELEAFRLGMIHGRMTSQEKEEAMSAFRTGETQVLVCTSVIEVGVDIPNATVLAVLSPNRFGLAQLHQLRGRIGRGQHAGFCGLLMDEEEQEDDESQQDSEAHKKEPLDEEAEIEPHERLQAFVKTCDGFELAEIDFQMRGPGDLLGTQQHGLPPLRMADLLRDAAIVEEAREEAKQLMEEDPGLQHDAHAKLRRMVLLRYGKALDLGDVG